VAGEHRTDEEKFEILKEFANAKKEDLEFLNRQFNFHDKRVKIAGRVKLFRDSLLKKGYKQQLIEIGVNVNKSETPRLGSNRINNLNDNLNLPLDTNVKIDKYIKYKKKLTIKKLNIAEWQEDEDQVKMIENENSLDEIRKIKKKAIKKKNTYIEKICFLRIIKLKSQEEPDQFIRKFKEALYAYEEKLYEKNNKNTKDNYLRQTFGIHQTGALFIKSAIKKGIYQNVVKKEKSGGFSFLQSKNMKQYTLENLVIEFSEQFPNELVEFCKEKLKS